MCCNGYSKTSTPSDHIEEDHVASPLPDGYWLAAFPFSDDNTELPDLVGYGLGFAGKPSAIKLFLNPGNDTTESVKVLQYHPISSTNILIAALYDGRCWRSRASNFLLQWCTLTSLGMVSMTVSQDNAADDFHC